MKSGKKYYSHIYGRVYAMLHMWIDTDDNIYYIIIALYTRIYSIFLYCAIYLYTTILYISMMCALALCIAWQMYVQVRAMFRWRGRWRHLNKGIRGYVDCNGAHLYRNRACYTRTCIYRHSVRGAKHNVPQEPRDITLHIHAAISFISSSLFQESVLLGKSKLLVGIFIYFVLFFLRSCWSTSSLAILRLFWLIRCELFVGAISSLLTSLCHICSLFFPSFFSVILLLPSVEVEKKGRWVWHKAFILLNLSFGYTNKHTHTHPHTLSQCGTHILFNIYFKKCDFFHVPAASGSTQNSTLFPVLFIYER